MTKTMSAVVLVDPANGGNRRLEYKVTEEEKLIDILQEYNSRKMLETGYRSFRSKRLEASCVAPSDYGDRFVRFFDEYTQPLPAVDESSESMVSPAAHRLPESDKRKSSTGIKK